MKFIPYIAVGIVLAIAAVFIWRHLQPDPVQLAPPAAGNVPTTVTPTVTRGDPALPKPDDRTTGVLRIVIPPDTTDPVRPGKAREIFVYIDEDPEQPPQVRSELPIQAAFSPVVDPWFLLEAHIMAGGSGSFDGSVSPWVGVAGIRLFRRVNVGVCVDRTAFGCFAGWEFFREFNAGAMYYVLPLRETVARAGFFIAYRF